MVRMPIFPNLPIPASKTLKTAGNYLTGLKGALAGVSVPFDCCLCREPEESGGLCKVCSKLLYLNDNLCARCACPLAVSDGVPAQVGCEGANTGTEPGCESCRQADLPWRRAIVPLRYSFPLDLLVIRYKYQGDMVVGRALGQLLGQQIVDFLDQHDKPPVAMVPIPLEASRFRHRGFNQSLELARAAATVCSLPVWNNVLRRERYAEADSTEWQNVRSRNLRMRTNAGGFVCSARLDAPVLLIDDVMTTGSTLKGAADALLLAGSPSVDVAAIGRTVDHLR